MNEEIWVTSDLDPRYKISTHGRIFKNGVHSLLEETKRGYFTVWIQKQNRLVHRVIAMQFIPNPDNLPQVNHIDGDKDNNAVNNLEWVTNKQNREHAMALKLHLRGEDQPNSLLTEEQVREIIAGRDIYKSRYLAKKYGVHSSTICDIQKGRTWLHIREIKNEI